MEGNPKAGLAKKAGGTNTGHFTSKTASNSAFSETKVEIPSSWLIQWGCSTGVTPQVCVLRSTERCREEVPLSALPAKSKRRSHQFDPNTREEGYSFRRLEGSWFAYDEGPS